MTGFVRRARALALAAAILGGMAPAALGNGWEHNAIPLPALLAALDSADEGLQAQAAVSLGVRREPAAVAPLVGLLDRPATGPRLRGPVYQALGQIGDARAVPALLGALDAEDREELRADAAQALGAIGDEAGLLRLLAALHGDPSLIVRMRAIDALGNFAAPAAVEALAALVQDDKSQSVRLRALRALGATGAPAAVKPLLTALRGRGELERGEAVEALGRLGAPAAAEPLRDLLDEVEDPDLRVRIVAALARIADPSALPTLVEMLRDGPPAARYQAVFGLARLGDARAVAPLLELYRELADGLAVRPNEVLTGEAPAALADYALLLATLRALLDLAPESGLPAFLDAARPRDFPRDSAAGLMLAEAVYELRRLAIVGLGYSRAPAAADYLTAGGTLADPDRRLRAAALRAIGVLGLAEAADAALPLLDDADGDVRRGAASVLGRLGDARAVGPLTARLADGHAGVRLEAALGLGYLGDPAALPALLAAADADGDDRVRAAARLSARLLGGDPP